jgi:hypothetical protein
MNAEKINCISCNAEITPANSFTCKSCKRTDLCIIHKGPSSGMCSICLEKFRKRLIYPTFFIITGIMFAFSPYLFKAVPAILVFPLFLLLPLWLFVEFARPVITATKLRKLLGNVVILSILIFISIIFVWDVSLAEHYMRTFAGFPQTIFLISGIVFLLMGFLFLISTSLSGLGVRILNYDYPEEYSLLLKKAGRDPEMVGVLKWDLKWITWINFIYGFFFVFLYLSSINR